VLKLTCFNCGYYCLRSPGKEEEKERGRERGKKKERINRRNTTPNFDMPKMACPRSFTRRTREKRGEKKKGEKRGGIKKKKITIESIPPALRSFSLPFLLREKGGEKKKGEEEGKEEGRKQDNFNPTPLRRGEKKRKEGGKGGGERQFEKHGELHAFDPNAPAQSLHSVNPFV